LSYDAFIFDVDGVLIDTSQSFSSAVLYAIEQMTHSTKFQLNHYNSLKELSGFNNDWDVAIAGAAWIKYYPETSFDSFLEIATEAKSELPNSFIKTVSRLAMESYGGDTACEQLYGFKPSSIQIDGMWKNEKSYLNRENIESILAISGIVTGRNKSEMELGFQILGWELPDSRVAISDNPKLDKPNPEKLLNVVSNVNCQSPIYFGDSIDDYFLVKNFNEQSNLQMTFCCVGENNQIPTWDYKVNTIGDFFKIYGGNS